MYGFAQGDSTKEGIAPEQILCGNGASELLMAVVRAAAPEKCAIAAPSFSGYERAVRAAGAEPVFYELSHDTGFGYETVCDRLSKMTVQMLFCAIRIIPREIQSRSRF